MVENGELEIGAESPHQEFWAFNLKPLGVRAYNYNIAGLHIWPRHGRRSTGRGRRRSEAVSGKARSMVLHHAAGAPVAGPGGFTFQPQPTTEQSKIGSIDAQEFEAGTHGIADAKCFQLARPAHF